MSQNPSFVAEEDLETSRFVVAGVEPYTIVKPTDGSDSIVGVTHEGSREAPIPGITPKAALTGESVRVYGDGEVCEVEAGGTVAAGNLVMSDANARAIAATAGNFTGGRALNDAVNLGRLRIQVQPGFLET